jgi:hypothetical protein
MTAFPAVAPRIAIAPGSGKTVPADPSQKSATPVTQRYKTMHAG